MSSSPAVGERRSTYEDVEDVGILDRTGDVGVADGQHSTGPNLDPDDACHWLPWNDQIADQTIGGRGTDADEVRDGMEDEPVVLNAFHFAGVLMVMEERKLDDDLHHGQLYIVEGAFDGQRHQSSVDTGIDGRDLGFESERMFHTNMSSRDSQPEKSKVDIRSRQSIRCRTRNSDHGAIGKVDESDDGCQCMNGTCHTGNTNCTHSGATKPDEGSPVSIDGDRTSVPMAKINV